jgi:hypothetical protein
VSERRGGEDAPPSSDAAATAEDLAIRDAASPGARARRGLPWLWAALFAALFAALLGRETSLAEIVARLRALPASALLGALASLALANVARAVRLRLLLPGRMSLGNAWAFNQLYTVVAATVPTGLGEAAAAWLLRRALRVPLHLGLVALFVGRFLDLIVLLALFLGVLLAGSVRLGDDGGAVVASAAGLLAVLVTLALVHLGGRARVTAWLERVARDLRPDDVVRRALRRVLPLVVDALQMVPHGTAAAQLVLATVVMQVVSLGALGSLLAGSGIAFDFATVLACFVIYILLRMLPVQGLAGIGTTAAWWALALTMLGVPSHDAATVGAVLYVAFYALLLLLGVASLPLLLRARRDA